jgi:DNA/RNA-binding domain of Phe-tRNA-synthetase-like protein
MLTVTERWAATYPDAFVGILVMRDVENPESCPPLEAEKARLERQLRDRFGPVGRAGIKAHPTIEAYNAYYKGFKKTYHVQHQLESVALKGRDIPRAAALVEAMFMAELAYLLLTAGHDLDAVVSPVRVDVADGSESYVRINGEAQVLKENDMYIADAEGVLSSIIYGPDQRTMITPHTKNALFTLYAPPGVPRELVCQHLTAIRDNVLMIAPEATVETLAVLSGEEGA